jgi:hypothetical protein
MSRPARKSLRHFMRHTVIDTERHADAPFRGMPRDTSAHRQRILTKIKAFKCPVRVAPRQVISPAL